MDGHDGLLEKLSQFMHKRLLWLMIGSYAIAACAPSAGLAIRDISVGTVAGFGQTTRISLSMLMLAWLLFNAGLGVRGDQIRQMLRRPSLLGAGLAANLLIPIAFILGVTRLMAGWHNADEVQNILVGLALVASMPIAGSSTAWAQNADGELTLSLGLVLFSTLLSPLTTPLALHSVGLMATGDYAEDLHELAAGGTGMFLALCVLAPSIIGIGVRHALGDARYTAAKPGLKLINSVILLVLNYSNASVSLPQAVADPDLDFLVVTLAIVVALCVLAFAAGWSISWLLKATPARRTSLMFGLGMNNNGTGLVLASMALADHPRVMLPIIFYNLVQHLVAGLIDRLTCSMPTPPNPPGVGGPGSLSWNLSSPYDWLRIARYAARHTPPGRPTPMAGSGSLGANPGRIPMRKPIAMTVVALVGLSFLSVDVRADDEKIAFDKLPTAVKKTIQRKFPKAEIEGASKEVEDGTTTYEVELEVNDRSVDVTLKPDGTILEIEKQVPVDALPKAVKIALAARYPGVKIEKVEEIVKGETGPVHYEVAIKAEVVLTAEGKFIKAGEDEDDDEKPSTKAKKDKEDDDEDDKDEVKARKGDKD